MQRNGTYLRDTELSKFKNSENVRTKYPPIIDLGATGKDWNAIMVASIVKRAGDGFVSILNLHRQ